MKQYRVGRRHTHIGRVLVVVFLISAGVTAAVNVAAFQANWRKQPQVIAQQASSPVPVAQPEAVLNPSDASIYERKTEQASANQLQAEFKKLADAFEDANFGLAYIPLTNIDEDPVTHNADRVFRSASLYKTLAAYRTLQRVDANQLNLQYVIDCVNLAIRISDNDCGINLQAAAQTDAANDIFTDLDMPNTTLSGYYPKTTAADQAQLYKNIYHASGLSENSHQILMQALSNQLVTNRMPNYPANVSSFHKTGDLENEVHSATIVERSDDAYVLVILSDNWSLPLNQRYQVIRNFALSVDTIISTR